MKTTFTIFKQLNLILLLSIFSSNLFATTYYSKTSGANWNDANGWSTTGYGQSTNTGTYPKSTDIANIGDGYSIYINATLSVGTINIGQGSSGIVEFAEAGNYSFSILNALTINSGGKLWYNGNSSRTHTLNIGTNLSNSGTLDLYADADDVVNLVFNRNVNSTVNGLGTFDLNTVTLTKTSSTSFYADVQSSGFENAIRDFIINYGTYNHHNSGTFNVNSSAISGFTIGSDAIFKITQGTVNLSPNQDETTLSGTIIVNGGTLKVGSTAGVTGLHYDKIGAFIPKLDIQSGTMEVYGSIFYKSGASTDPLNFNMSGGILLLNSGSTKSSNSPLFINDVLGSAFVMNDGLITIEAPNISGNSISDFVVCGTNGTVSSGGGIVAFGNNNTTSGSIFTLTPFSSVTLPNIKVTGSNAANIVLCPSANSTANMKALSLYIDQNKTFDLRSVSGTTGDSRSLILTGNIDGINALYSDGTLVARSSHLIFQGIEAQQISGSEIQTLYDLTINNSFGISLAQEVDISGYLSLTNGVLFTSNSSPVSLLAGANCDVGSSTSYVEGPFIQTVTSTLPQTIYFPIGKDGSYRLMSLDVTHSTASAVTYSGEMFNSNPRNLNYTLPTGIDKVSSVRYFQLNRSGPSNLVSASISLNYDVDDGVNDYQYLRIARDDGSSNWVDAGGVGTSNSTGTITSSSFNNPSNIFTFGNAFGGSNVLPVKLISFIAKNEKNKIALYWTTASEKNADRFEIQKSINGSEFNYIGECKANGNSNKIRNYSFYDSDLCNSKVYYKLKQIDFDGKFEYSTIQVVNEVKSSNFSIAPNPGHSDEIKLLQNDLTNEECKIQILDVKGNVVLVKYLELNYNSQIPLGMPSIPGNYLIRISNSNSLVDQKIVVIE